MEIVNDLAPVGLGESELAFIEVPKNGHEMHEGDRLRWNPQADLRIDAGGDSPTEQQQPWRRKPSDLEFGRRETPRHIHREWQTTIHRRSNDISKKRCNH